MKNECGTDFFLNTSVQKWADVFAIISSDQKLSYKKLNETVLGLSAHLLKSYKTGERIAILSENSISYIILLLACWQAGLGTVPLSTRWPQEKINANLAKINCKAIFTSQQFANKFNIPFFEITEFKNFVQKNQFMINCNPKQDATILFTSGSSGDPKAVLHSLENHVYSALGSNENIKLNPGDSWLLSLPLYHVGGLAIIFRTLLSGASIIISEKSLNDSIKHFEPTHLSLVSTQLYRLLDDETVLPTMQKSKAILLGGSSFSKNLIESALNAKLKIHKSYGMTEMGSQITTTAQNASRRELESSGKILPYREIQIDKSGEILVRGKTLCKGFVVVDKIIEANEWYRTGDVGEFDDIGFLHVHGRIDNQFISGGENIQPEEIEQVLLTVQNVEQVVVVPQNNDEFGERPVAFLKMNKGSVFDKKRCEKLIEQILPKFMIPDHFYAWPNLKDGMKIDRQFFIQLAQKKAPEIQEL